MVRGESISPRRCALDQTRTWQLAGRLRPPGADPAWESPERALDVLALAGYGAVAVSVAWARVEPEPGRRDGQALERYAAVLAMAVDRGLTPTLVVGDGWPWWLGEELWLRPGAPDRFAGHVAEVAQALGRLGRRWAVRQPSALPGYVLGAAPPGRRWAVADAWAVADNLLCGHVLAHRAVHEAVAGAEVVLSLPVSRCYEWHRLVVDLAWARRLGVSRDQLDAWLAARRRDHDRAEPARTLAERSVRAVAGALSPYGDGALSRPSPRRAVELLFGGPHEGPAEGVLMEWSPRRVPWDRTPASLSRWCDDQRRLTPGALLWVEDEGAALEAEAEAAGLDGYLRRPFHLVP